MIRATLYFMAVILSLTSCAHENGPEENIKKLESGNVGAVISWCNFKYYDKRSGTERVIPCQTWWKSELTGEFLALDSYNDLRFVKPGTYDLDFFLVLTYNNPNNREENYHGKFVPGFAPKLSVKGGEILYIGDFYIDITTSLDTSESTRIKYSDKDWHLPALRKKYPSYFNTKTNLESKIRWPRP